MVTRINGTNGITKGFGIYNGTGEQGLLQTKMVTSGPDLVTWTSASPQPVADLSIDFTPQRSDSLIIAYTDISCTRSYVNSWAIYKDGTATVDTSAGSGNSNGPDMNLTAFLGSNTVTDIYPNSVIWSETSGSTATRTYAVYGLSSWSTINYAVYVNDRSSADMSCYSSFTVMEIYNG